MPSFKIIDINVLAAKYPMLVTVKKQKVVTEVKVANEKKIAAAIRLGIVPDGVEVLP